jgi:hypothetical protein
MLCALKVSAAGEGASPIQRPYKIATTVNAKSFFIRVPPALFIPFLSNISARPEDGVKKTLPYITCVFNERIDGICQPTILLQLFSTDAITMFSATSVSDLFLAHTQSLIENHHRVFSQQRRPKPYRR